MDTKKLIFFKEKIQSLESELKSYMGELTEDLEEYDWQNTNIGFVLNEEKEDAVHTEVNALEEAHKLIFHAWEHLDYIIKREG